MNKKLQLNNVKYIDPTTVLFETNHFDVTVTIPERFNTEWDNNMMSLDYNIVRRTTYTTKFQVKKFIQRTFMKLLLDCIRSNPKG